MKVKKCGVGVLWCVGSVILKPDSGKRQEGKRDKNKIIREEKKQPCYYVGRTEEKTNKENGIEPVLRKRTKNQDNTKGGGQAKKMKTGDDENVSIQDGAKCKERQGSSRRNDDDVQECRVPRSHTWQNFPALPCSTSLLVNWGGVAQWSRAAARPVMRCAVPHWEGRLLLWPVALRRGG